MSLLREIIRNKTGIKYEEYADYLNSLLDDRSKKSTLTALMAALSAKPLNIDDIVNLVKFVEHESPKQDLSVSDKVINIVGTGGGIASFNISTTATFVAAAAGAMVLKSGSYSYNSKCGSLDLLAKLGINLNTSRESLESMLEELNIGFVSPQMYPPVLRRIAVSVIPLTLREIGGIINTIGPLICPFRVHGQICGVRSHQLVPLFAQALQSLEMKNSISVWSEIGLDEFSAIGINHYSMVKEQLTTHRFDPAEFAMNHSNPVEISGGTPEQNIEIMHSILKGKDTTAARDTVVVNAAFMLLLSGQYQSIQDAIIAAKSAINSGSAFQLLQNVIEFSHDHRIAESLS